MKALFIIAAIAGFAGVLTLGATWAPYAPERVRAQVDVVPNVGRTERFVIRLPLDRIADSGPSLAGAGFPAALEWPAALAGMRAEQFKLRNAGGEVIGLAARHAHGGPDGRREAAWLLFVPGRGALALAQPDFTGGLAEAMRQAGFDGTAAWQGEVRYVGSGDGDGDGDTSGFGRIVHGTGEFENLLGVYDENWTVTGVDEAGRVRGTIELLTVARAGS
jgi:hypothetical protein